MALKEMGLVAAGAALGYTASKVGTTSVPNTLELEWFQTDSFEGIPLTPLQAEVLRDIRGETPPSNPSQTYALSPPRATPTPFDAASSAALKAVAQAPNLKAAFEALTRVPAFKKLTQQYAAVPVYYGVRQLRDPLLAAIGAGPGMARHFANVLEVLATPNGFRFRATEQFAAATDSTWILDTPNVYLDKRIADSFFAFNALSNDQVAQESGLTPAMLADNVRALFQTGAVGVSPITSRA